MLDGLCQRYGCLPSALLAEDGDRLLRMLQLVSAGRMEQQAPTGIEDELAGVSRSIGGGR